MGNLTHEPARRQPKTIRVNSYKRRPGTPRARREIQAEIRRLLRLLQKR